MNSAYIKFAAFLEKRFRFDAHYFLQGGFWISTGQVIATCLGLVSTILFAHLLSPNDYGVYKYLIGLVGIFSAFSLTGLGQAILQTAAKGFGNFYKETIKVNLLYSCIVSVSSLTASLYYLFQDNLILSSGCLLIAILQPFINVFQFIPVFLIGKQKFKEATIFQIVKVFTSTLFLVSLLLLTKNVVFLFAGYLLVNLIINLISYKFYTKNDSGQSPSEVLTQYLSYAKHTSVRNLISNIAYRLDNIVIFTQLGAAELAIYTIANIIPEQIKGSFKNIASLLLPKYAKHNDINVVINSVPQRSIYLFVIFSLVTIFYILLAPLIINFLFPKYTGSITLSQLAALSFPAAVAIIPFSLLQAQKKERALHMLNLQSSAITVTLTLLLIPLYGLLGAIIAKICSRYYNFFLSFYYLHKEKS